MATTTDIPVDFASMEPDELVQAIEEIEAIIRQKGVEVTRLRGEKTFAEAHLMGKLSSGEAVQAPSGRVVFKDEGPQGSATVNKAALEEHIDALPPSLRLRYETKYPGVAAIREAARKGELPAGVTEADLLIEAPRGSTLRWRTLGGES